MSEVVTPPVTTPPATTPPAPTTPPPAVTPPATPPAVEPPKEGAPPAEPPKVEPPAAPTVPEKYELKLPEGSLLPAETLASVEAFAKEHKLTQAQAESILSRENAAAKSYHDSLVAEDKRIKDSYIPALQNDPQFGGANFDKNVERVHRFMKHYGGEDFKKELDASGFGNHPGLVKMIHNFAQHMGDDSFEHAGSGASGGAKTTGQLLYPDMK